MPSAYLLVSHGSRDPRPEIAMQHLAQMVRNKLHCLQPKSQMVGVAYLELSPESLHEQVIRFARDAIACGCDRLKILPLFLLPGVHVMEDIPSQVDLARQVVGEDIMIDLLLYLGSNSGLKRLLERKVTNNYQWILLAHGSRRSGSKLVVEDMAACLGAVAAYWNVKQSLLLRVRELIGAGYEKIGILPYFLFAGGVTDAICWRIEELRLEFSEVCFFLAEPLGMSDELVDLVWELLE
ncbi:sirohydrochlorin chelatase [Iningainema tapete]|uniref:Sirohydrochlorin chelatase n=1 Tax=Iningainema tapete BLCC-T55 TaxID=2748662 RepID=A0A8J6XF50_9CYAN|nr:sirohydrochlorin chelatase [Iningainema tapete]MBD2775460.1 sirohydrochlorin chelatase [Iningainema tapete BLCC-T55]